MISAPTAERAPWTIPLPAGLDVKHPREQVAVEADVSAGTDPVALSPALQSGGGQDRPTLQVTQAASQGTGGAMRQALLELDEQLARPYTVAQIEEVLAAA